MPVHHSTATSHSPPTILATGRPVWRHCRGQGGRRVCGRVQGGAQVPRLRDVPAAGGPHHLWPAHPRAADHRAGGVAVQLWRGVVGWRAVGVASRGLGVQGCAARIEVRLRRAGCKHSQTPSVRRAIQPNRAHPPPPAATQSRLGEASHPKTRTKLANLLQHAARGVLGNPTGEPPLGLATGGTYSRLCCVCLKCGSTPASAGDTAQLATACSAPLPPYHRHPASQPPPRTSASSSSQPPTRGWRRRRRRASGPRPPRAPLRPAPTVRPPDASRRPQGRNGVLRLR